MPHTPELSLLLHRALEPRLGRLLELCHVDQWQEDPEGLHQVRIASRRVRAVLDLVDPELYPGFRKHEKHLRRLTKALGLTRELDVHALTLEALKVRQSEPLLTASAEHLLELLDRKRCRAREAMHRDLEAVSLKDLDRLLVTPNFPEPLVMADLPFAVWNCLEPWIRAVEAVLPPLLNQENGPELHKLRIQVKRLRYTLEILESAFPTPLEDCLQRLKALQTALGQHHDQAMLEAFLWEVHAALTGRQRTTLASGVLDLLGAVAEERRIHFEHFQALGREHRDAVLFFHLKQALHRVSG
jgi:CHAD domain-containing protein